MLKEFENLFDGLNKKNINYCIYKGYHHLNKDLSDGIGDIDLLIDKNDFYIFNEFLLSSGFLKVNRFVNRPLSYFKFDPESHSILKLDVDFVIRIGNRPDMEYFLEIDFKNLSLELDGNMMKLSIHDYIPLMFVMRNFSNKKNNENFLEIKKSIKDVDINKSYFAKLIEQNNIEWSNVVELLESSNNWVDFNKSFSSEINSLPNIKLDLYLLFKKKFEFIFRVNKFFKRKFGIPQFNYRKNGLIVAFVGVDGAGKTSSIDYIESLEFFKKTGVKKIYFGNNKFWIPGLNFLLKNKFDSRIYSIFLSTLCSLDRQLRIIGAIYYRLLGNIVLADRYFYDDQIARQKRATTHQSVLQKIYHKIFDVRMLLNPDVTIFLDVSPEVAYSRKQDYSYEKMLEINSLYKKFMSQVKGVKIIDSDANQNEIYTSILNCIINVENEKNN